MAAGSDSALVHGDDLRRQVLASFPLCRLTEEDLVQNPGFCRLLSSLSQRVDQTGLSLPLRRDLEKAEQELQAQRLAWLRSESLLRLLQEVLQKHCVRKQLSGSTADDDKFYATLEQCLLLTQSGRLLDPSSTMGQEEQQLLQLRPQNLLSLLPPPQDVNCMKQRLLAELETQLKEKCMAVLSYHQPGCENEGEGLKALKLSRLPESLEQERKRAESQRERNRESAALLLRQSHCYLSELLGCVHLLQSILLDHRLKTQKELDGKKVDYLEAKCQLIIDKIRVEMLEIQMATYTPNNVAAHKKIREMLDSELSAARTEKQSAESTLSSFQILGREFEELAKEYSRLRQEIDNKRWALKEFS